MEFWVLIILVPVVALLVGAFYLYLEHHQKMAAIASRPADVDTGLRAEFETLRDGITAHSLSLDENLKNLASRLTALENRVAEEQQRVSQ